MKKSILLLMILLSFIGCTKEISDEEFQEISFNTEEEKNYALYLKEEGLNDNLKDYLKIVKDKEILNIQNKSNNYSSGSTDSIISKEVETLLSLPSLNNIKGYTREIQYRNFADKKIIRLVKLSNSLLFFRDDDNAEVGFVTIDSSNTSDQHDIVFSRKIPKTYKESIPTHYTIVFNSLNVSEYPYRGKNEIAINLQLSQKIDTENNIISHNLKNFITNKGDVGLESINMILNYPREARSIDVTAKITHLKNINLEKFMNIFHGETFTTALDLVSFDDSVKKYSKLVTGIFDTIAEEINKPQDVLKFNFGIHNLFTDDAIGLNKMAKGIYIVLMCPASISYRVKDPNSELTKIIDVDTAFDWDDWYYDSKFSKIYNKYTKKELKLNYIIFNFTDAEVIE